MKGSKKKGAPDMAKRKKQSQTTTSKSKKAPGTQSQVKQRTQKTEAEKKNEAALRLAEVYKRYQSVNDTLRRLYNDRKYIDADILDDLRKTQNREFKRIINRLKEGAESATNKKSAFLEKHGIKPNK